MMMQVRSYDFHQVNAKLWLLTSPKDEFYLETQGDLRNQWNKQEDKGKIKAPVELRLYPY